MDVMRAKWNHAVNQILIVVLLLLLAALVTVISARAEQGGQERQGTGEDAALQIHPPVPEARGYFEDYIQPAATPEPWTVPTPAAERGAATVKAARTETRLTAAPLPEDEDAEPETDEDDLDRLACVIYQEAGSDYIADETRYMVGDVVLTRVADARFPDTLEGVLTQKGQYGEFYRTGIRWPERAQWEPEAVQRAYDTARDLLTGTRHSALYAGGYIWQAEFPQGTDVIFADGLYFGR